MGNGQKQEAIDKRQKAIGNKQKARKAKGPKGRKAIAPGENIGWGKFCY